MSTELVQANGQAAASVVSPETLERVVCDGDLSKLTPAQRVEWYIARCEACGLDWRTQPFRYLSLGGKLVLYADKGCTEQLRKNHGVSVVGIEAKESQGIWFVLATVKDRTGRTDVSTGAVPIKGLQGEALSNAFMKAETKAKRRATLSLCGLGMLDESEIDSINGAERVSVESAHYAVHYDNGTGYGRTQAYADPATTNEFRIWVSGFVDEVNAKWLDRHTDANGEVLEGVKDLLSTYQVSNHLVKWAVAEGLIQAPTDGGKAGQRDKFAAAAWMKNRAAVITEAEDYGRSKWKEAKRLLMARETKDVPEGPAEPEGADPHDVDYPPEPGSNG